MRYERRQARAVSFFIRHPSFYIPQLLGQAPIDHHDLPEVAEDDLAALEIAVNHSP